MQAKTSSKNQLSVDVIVRIKNELIRRKLSQRKLADAVGVTPQAVTNWFTGKSGIERAQMIKVAEFLDMSMDFLFREPNDKSTSGLILKEAPERSLSYPSRVVLNPQFQPSKPSADVEKIDKFLEPWRQAASKDADIASYLYTKLKLTLPHSDLETLKAVEDD